MGRVTLAKGGKTEYSQSYKGFSRESSETFKELTNGESKENVLALTGYGGLFNVYPDNEESLKEAREMREKVTYFLLDRRMANLTAHRITPNITSISEIWRINFEKTDEVVLGYRQSKTAGSQREKEVTISGKIFKRFGDLRSVLAVMTMKKAENSLMLHLVNANTGAIIVSKKLAEKMPAKVPLMAFYDNAVIVGLHEGQEKQDSIIVAEICVAQEMANTADETGKTVKKVTDIELIYPIITTVALDWKVFGMEMVRTQDAEYIVTVDQKNNVKAVDTLKLLRGGNQKADAASTKTVDVPDSVIFRAPVAIQYSYKTKNLLIHGMDIYSCEFP